MSKCGMCGVKIPKGHYMCDDCYMWMRGISPGPQSPEQMQRSEETQEVE